MKNNTIIIAVIAAILIVIGAFLALTLLGSPGTSDNKTQITASGSKVTIINNNQDVWAHWKLQLQNVPEKNGSQQTYYVEEYIKPGENVTFDLSTITGNGDEPLAQDTKISVLGWGGLHNLTAGEEGKFNSTFLGWTTNETIPTPPLTYKSAIDPLEVDPMMTIGALPGNITGNTITIGTSNPSSDTNDELFLQFNIIIGPYGVPYFELKGTPTLCEVIVKG